mmetsp:Transcript_9696/g.27634  ORF Transcript_9696/g.27634 Transcript_9696/m.27634 type:complete len:276 (-) Transcript_9696:84-911(-)
MMATSIQRMSSSMSNNIWAMMDSVPNVQKSPNMPAMGDAMLSGFIPKCRAIMTIAVITAASRKDARLAVETDDADMSSMCFGCMVCVAKTSKTKATSEARKPTTIAWHWTTARLPKAISRNPSKVSSSPLFACVPSLDARVISRLPFRPRSAGTRISSSSMTMNTGHFLTTLSKSPAATMPRPATRNGGNASRMSVKLACTRSKYSLAVTEQSDSQEPQLGRIRRSASLSFLPKTARLAMLTRNGPCGQHSGSDSNSLRPLSAAPGVSIRCKLRR